MVKKRRLRLKSSPKLLGDAVYGLLEQMGGAPAKARLAGLWENWQEAMGGELAELMCNYGNRGELLILCAENPFQMQNLQFAAQDVLARANAYLGSEYFTGVRVSLYGAEKKNARQPEESAAEPEASFRAEIAATGEFLEEMDMASPVARCYAAFTRRK